MFYYLDKEDGYSKGPYSWEELKRLPLAPETYIFDQQRVEWRTLEAYHAKMAAEAKAMVRPAPRSFVQENEKSYHEYAPAPLPPRPAPAPVAPPKKTPASYAPPQTKPRPKTTVSPAPAFPPFDKNRPFTPMQPGQNAENPMGISGVGCFVAALIIAFIMGLIFWVAF